MLEMRQKIKASTSAAIEIVKYVNINFETNYFVKNILSLIKIDNFYISSPIKLTIKN